MHYRQEIRRGIGYVYPAREFDIHADTSGYGF